jgi:uncharacterized protein (DUF952 family)
MIILHTLKKVDWEKYKNEDYYGEDSIEKFGFIHCSDIKNHVEVANREFLDDGEVIILCIETEKVDAKIKWEDLKNRGVSFPHIYGRLNLDAVLRVLDFPRNNDGTFILPRELDT